MPNEVFIGVDVCKPRLDLMIFLAHKTAPGGLFALSLNTQPNRAVNFSRTVSCGPSP